MAHPITGLHHLTAMASDARQNLRFYTQVLGLRLVKKTVNFDDPFTYHFYFGGAAGSPGTLLTFFPWPDLQKGRPGTGMVTAVAFSVAPDSLDYWKERLQSHGVTVGERSTRFGEPVLPFMDPDGLHLEIIETAAANAAWAWTGADVPAAHALCGMHSLTASVEGHASTAALLEDRLGFRHTGADGNRFRYEAGPGGPGHRLDLLCSPDALPGRGGSGTVHHVAFDIPTDEAQQALRAELIGDRYNVSPVMDRSYFHSIYFREPNGVLFEVATSGPGFAIDEEAEHLGEKLLLPVRYEQIRPLIEQRLPALD